MLIVIFGLLGIVIGSFLNVCIDRLPAGRSLVYPPSHCDACQKKLSPKDLIPVFSYIRLRGRCRYCRVSIPRRIVWIEIASGLLFSLAYWLYGLSAEFILITAYCCLFIVIGFIDLKHGLILNKIVYPSLLVALIISIFLPNTGTITPPWWPVVVNGVIGGCIGFTFLLVPALIYRGGMGWGDVKMAGLIGMVVGFPLVFVALLIGVITGAVVSGILLLLKIKKRKEAIPFGPFLSLATIITLLAGNNILNWYFGMF
ncbi:prepilin peptidase [Chloroflexota bacterium]